MSPIYQQHPLSAAFPNMTKADLAALSADISEQGQREPITIYEGKILDGWHRYQVCIVNDRVPVTAELPAGVDPVSHPLWQHNIAGVRSWNGRVWNR